MPCLHDGLAARCSTVLGVLNQFALNPLVLRCISEQRPSSRPVILNESIRLRVNTADQDGVSADRRGGVAMETRCGQTLITFARTRAGEAAL